MAEDNAPAPALPRTRYRQSATLAGEGSAGPPPTPSLPGAGNESIRAAVALWRSIRHAGRLASAAYHREERATVIAMGGATEQSR